MSFPVAHQPKTTPRARPLDGVVIADFSRVLAGPYAGSAFHHRGRRRYRTSVRRGRATA